MAAHEDHGGHGAHGENGGQGAHGGHVSHGGHGGHRGHGAAPDIPGIEPHFMSMVELTEGKPASPDGLIMEWIEAPFGPFFPGLPAGLHLTFTLDGDSVAGAEIRSLATSAPQPGFAAAQLPDRLAMSAPLAPVAMRELACRALEAAADSAPDADRAAARAAGLERERIASHLNWLAGLARQVGLVWLERRAAVLHQGLAVAGAVEIAGRARAIRGFLVRLRRTPLLREKLGRIGPIRPDALAPIGGPVARAAGVRTDARAGEPACAALGFAVRTQAEGDAWARFNQRLDEIEQSLDLVVRAGAIVDPQPPDGLPDTGHGAATVETPRGPATLHLNLKDGSVEVLQLTTPFTALADLVGRLVAEMELADALTAVGSLDLDPWGTRA